MTTNKAGMDMTDYENVLDEKNRKRRIEIVLADSYGEDEAYAAFGCYLEDHISFPFQARLRGDKKSVVFIVEAFTSVDPPHVVCGVSINGVKSRMPLTEIEPMERKSTNWLVIEDYLEFIGREY